MPEPTTPEALSDAAGPPLLAVGVDFRSAPLELRERVHVDRAGCVDLLVRLLADSGIGEVLVLSTCNRTEAYVRPREPERAFRAVMAEVFARAPEIEQEGRFAVRHGPEAARHLLTVAAGLESMVLGEPEILGQVRQAAEVGAEVGSTGPLLARLLDTALRAGGRVRTETTIGAGAVSLGYATVELARQVFGDLGRHRALVVGAGETGRLAARALLERGVGELSVTNRSEDVLAAFVTELGGNPLPFAERHRALVDHDLVVVSTGASEPVLVADEVKARLSERRGRALLVVDLGVPRNVDPRVGRLENVFLHDIDALQALLDRNLDRRRQQVPRVEAIVREELERFLAGWRAGAAEPLVAELQRRAERLRQREVATVKERFPPELHDELDRLTRSLVRKILHHPSRQLRSPESAPAHHDLVRELFRLGDAEDEG